MHEHETKMCAAQGINQRMPWICWEKANYMLAVTKDIKRSLLNTVTGFFGNFCLFIIALCHSPLKNQKRLSWCNLTSFTNKTTLMKIPESLDRQTEYFHYIHLKSNINSTTSRKCIHLTYLQWSYILLNNPKLAAAWSSSSMKIYLCLLEKVEHDIQVLTSTHRVNLCALPSNRTGFEMYLFKQVNRYIRGHFTDCTWRQPPSSSISREQLHTGKQGLTNVESEQENLSRKYIQMKERKDRLCILSSPSSSSLPSNNVS